MTRPIFAKPNIPYVEAFTVKDGASGRVWCSIYAGLDQEREAEDWRGRGWRVEPVEPTDD